MKSALLITAISLVTCTFASAQALTQAQARKIMDVDI